MEGSEVRVGGRLGDILVKEDITIMGGQKLWLLFFFYNIRGFALVCSSLSVCLLGH